MPQKLSKKTAVFPINDGDLPPIPRPTLLSTDPAALRVLGRLAVMEAEYARSLHGDEGWRRLAACYKLTGEAQIRQLLRLMNEAHGDITHSETEDSRSHDVQLVIDVPAGIKPTTSRYRTRYQQRKDLGMCPGCGKEKPLPDYVHGPNCLKKKNDAAYDHRKQAELNRRQLQLQEEREALAAKKKSQHPTQ